jgi:predicted GNAT superfamily acetyltransferase
MTDVITYRDLHAHAEFAAVVELEREIWGPGYDEVVPTPILAVSVHRGGILIGAFAADRMVGFVYSLPGIKAGRPTQWSHMAGVVAGYRSAGIGHQLKVLQRERAVAMGLDLIEWTYDPLQAMNAHLNFVKLGVVVEEYAENIYGESTSPLHRGNPTDRFVAEWWIRKPHVERRVSGPGTFWLRASEVADAPIVNPAGAAADDRWLACGAPSLDLDARRVGVEIPMGFTEMMAEAPDLALEWRMATRRIFTTYFGRGYKAVEFFLNREARKGTYLLATQD